MTDRECLLEALAALGFGSQKVEVHDEPVALVGYEGTRRGQEANIVIRRAHVGGASNDIGFLATKTGYQAFVSDYDRGRHGNRWLAELNTRYQAAWTAKQERLAEEERKRVEEERRQLVEAQREAIHRKAKKLGYRVQETREDGKLRLVLIKRVY
ncbi:hypothetical protein PPSIR1_22164 [Plesiocystis pacifica SIR-1]|uniref:Uncharacterized protein n=2 Tax=Plesiocystis pacifica TaxID=191768 RepID=A6FXT0_9BACT|nr:hypothetical protein PPSIR1_22164 [Plesiocystis pacifica SIR-1]